MKTTLLSTIALFLTFCHSHFAQECIDIPNLPTNQINANISDDTNYPVGSAFYNEGNIDFIKTPNTSLWNHQPGDTTICTSGANFMISVANASAPKTLTIDMDSEYGMVVDGDTIYDNSNPPANYSGNNFNFTHVANPISEYTIDGDFDTVEVLANNLCIYDICLEENTLNIEESLSATADKLTIYPNPAQRSETVKMNNSTDIEQLVVRSLNGQLMLHSNPSSQHASFAVNERFERGVYIISLFIDNRWEHRKLMIK
ncbi:MAG: T9SS type A sorting domain-containing protein [Bacteroidota bacterium]